MELRRYLAILRRRALLIVLAIAVAVGFTISTADQTARYTATSTLYIGVNVFSTTGNFDPNLSADQQQGFTRLATTFAIMIRSTPVAADALDITGVPRSAQQVAGATNALPIEDTNILIITVTDTDPSIAQRLSTGLAEAFVRKISAFEPGRPQGEGDVPAAPVRIFERAKLPVVPQKESVMSSIIIAGLFALLLSGGIILLIEYLDVTVKTVDDVERRLELPVIGIVPQLALDPNTTLRRPPTARRPDIELVKDA